MKRASTLLLLAVGCCAEVSQKSDEPSPQQTSRQTWTVNGKTLTVESTGNVSATGRFDGRTLTIEVTTD